MDKMDLLNNKQIVELIATMNVPLSDAIQIDMMKRLSALWDFYKEHSDKEDSLMMFAKGILSKKGTPSGVHPLDVIYSYILEQNLLSGDDNDKREDTLVKNIKEDPYNVR